MDEGELLVDDLELLNLAGRRAVGCQERFLDGGVISIKRRDDRLRPHGGQGGGDDLGVPVLVAGVEAGVGSRLPGLLVRREQAIEIGADGVGGVADGVDVALEGSERHLDLVDGVDKAGDGGGIDGLEVLHLVLQLGLHDLQLVRGVDDELSGLKRGFDVLQEVDVIENERLGGGGPFGAGEATRMAAAMMVRRMDASSSCAVRRSRAQGVGHTHAASVSPRCRRIASASRAGGIAATISSRTF